MDGTRLVAWTVAGVLLVLAAFHIYWALGGKSAGAAIPSSPDGAPTFRPGPLSTLAVAAALTVAATLVLARTGLLGAVLPTRLVATGTWAVAIAFGLRTIGEFRYVGLFKRIRTTEFARWDSRLFTPLCFALSAATGWLASR